jgi:hypothetical protein
LLIVAAATDRMALRALIERFHPVATEVALNQHW